MMTSLTLQLQPRVRLKMDKMMFQQFHTSVVVRKKKEKSRLEIFKDKIVFEEDLDKRPSDMEIKAKDLPVNQPTLRERIDRDNIHTFYQQDEKHGYFTRKPLTLMEEMKIGLKTNPKKLVTESFSVVKDEIAKFSQEIKDGEYNRAQQMKDAIVLDGQRRKEWGFQSELEIDQWILTKDSDWGEGYSSAEFRLNDAGTAGVLSGNLSTRVPNDGRTEHAGYVNIASVNKRVSFGRLKLLEHWNDYTHLTMNVRGDGRKYMINLKTKADFDILWDDRWHYPLFTRGGPYWQYVKIPFSKFYLGSKGYIQDKQDPVPLFRIQAISFTLKDRISGPFRLEVKDVSLHNDPFGDDEKFAYEMYKLPDFYIGGD